MKTKLLAGSAPVVSVRIDAGFLRVPEFCELIKITKNTAALMRLRRQGPPYVKVGAKTIIWKAREPVTGFITVVYPRLAAHPSCVLSTLGSKVQVKSQ